MSKVISSWLHSSWFKGSFLVVTLIAGGVFAWRVQGQSPPSIRVGGVEITGIPEDWSNHYVVFSDPGTEQEAIRSGRYAEWQSIVNEPRYVIQQLKRNAPVRGPAAGDAQYKSWWISLATHRRPPPAEFGAQIKTDWSQMLGGPGLAAGHFPAKFSLDPTTASCNDYVVFPTGAAGATNHAEIVAFTNLYVGAVGPGCSTTNPTVYWAYNIGTDMTADLSPVLSLDGSQVAFIQRSSANPPVASLVILKTCFGVNTAACAPPQGSVSAPVTLTPVDPTLYSGCTAPCVTTLQLAGSTTQPTNTGSVNDTNSAPFYRYFDDVLYVGDDSGIAHRFNPVFIGTPAETGNALPNHSPSMGWPAAVDRGFPLTSPVFDFQPVSPTNTQGCMGSTALMTNVNCEPRVWIGDANGHLNWINTSPPASQFVNSSIQLACANKANDANATGTQVDVGIQDPALVDVTNGNVYVFVGYGCTSPAGAAPHSGFIGQFSKNNSPGTSEQTRANFNGASSPSATTVARTGAFDNIFLSGGNGHIYACVDGQVYQTPLTATGSLNPKASLANIFSTPVSTVSNASACSPVTEFLGAKEATTLIQPVAATGGGQITLMVMSTTGLAMNDYLQIGSEIMSIINVTPPTSVLVNRGQFGTAMAAHPSNTPVLDIQDRLFVSVRSNGMGSCTGACVYNYNITAGNTSGTPTAGLMVMPPSGSAILASENNSTSGIIADNRAALNGAQQIYFSTRTSPISNAVQASQSTLSH